MNGSREPELAGQTVVVLGGSSGMGFETAKRARSEGADVVLSGRNPERVERAARELGALSSAAFDATDFKRLRSFFDELPKPVDHIMVTAGGPYYARLADIDFTQARRNVEEELWLPLHVARFAAGKVRPGGTLLFIGGTGFGVKIPPGYRDWKLISMAQRRQPQRSARHSGQRHTFLSPSVKAISSRVPDSQCSRIPVLMAHQPSLDHGRRRGASQK
jgi:NAD(P)-dependent dehydrogenase (short-subunit alcohol dehydrogenase family)